ncbi:MAG: polysaccharide biosynthesis/export family protein [Prevotellaceae bacterium]|nr:polysaccharide biosynthesis/export family protein [Prevotellaceae bacterium]
MKYFFSIIIAVLLITSCVTTRRINYLQRPNLDIPDYVDTIGFKDYRMQAGDYLSIKAYSITPGVVEIYNGTNNAGGSGDVASSRLFLYRIGEDGNFEYPYIGKIYALGKTTRELKFELEKMFDEVAKNVSVDVRLSNRSFSMIGEGGSKRISMPNERITIFQALAMAGDLGTFADRSRIKLVRLTEKGTVVKEFDIRTIKIIDSEFYYIQPNDVIYIQHSFAKYVGIDHIKSAIGVTLSTVSFGLMVWQIGDRIKK